MAITKDSKPLGKYGRMCRTYMQEHHKVLYNQMLLDGSLWPHLREIDEQAQSTVNAIIARMAEIDGLTEELKVSDPMRWGAVLRRRPLPKAEAPTEAAAETGLMNNYRHCAEELVIREVVY